MLWFGKNRADSPDSHTVTPAPISAQEAPIPAAPERPRPEAIEPEGTMEELYDYVALCEKADAVTPAVRMLQLEHFLAERGIPDYDPEQVGAYLNMLAKNGCFDLYPLRLCDQNISIRWYEDEKHRLACNYLRYIYHHAVPASVMNTVCTIHAEFPDAHFFVAEANDDPFLFVAFDGVFPLIVDFWSEPGFKPR